MMRTVMQAKLGHGDPWDGEMVNCVRVKIKPKRRRTHLHLSSCLLPAEPGQPVYVL